MTWFCLKCDSVLPTAAAYCQRCALLEGRCEACGQRYPEFWRARLYPIESPPKMFYCAWCGTVHGLLRGNNEIRTFAFGRDPKDGTITTHEVVRGGLEHAGIALNLWHPNVALDHASFDRVARDWKDWVWGNCAVIHRYRSNRHEVRVEYHCQRCGQFATAPSELIEHPDYQGPFTLDAETFIAKFNAGQLHCFKCWYDFDGGKQEVMAFNRAHYPEAFVNEVTE
jgi:hypothetical protein